MNRRHFLRTTASAVTSRVATIDRHVDLTAAPKITPRELANA